MACSRQAEYVEHSSCISKNRQLWNTEFSHFIHETDSHDNVSSCICCVRPILKDDYGTRKMTMTSWFGDMLHKCCTDTENIIHNEQCKLLRNAKITNEVFVCYICQPSWKKSLSQYTAETKIDIPYSFMLLSDRFMRNVEYKGTQTDKLSLLKYILCTSTQIRIVGQNVPDQIIYHPIRTSDFVLLEQSILFFRYIFEYYNFTVRAFDQCPFEMVNIAEWHISGFPLLMSQQKKSQDLRKAIRGTIGKHYWKMNMLKHKPEDMHLKNNSRNVCAACCRNRNTKNKKRSYDSFFLDEWEYIEENIAHGILFRNDNRSVKFILCNTENKMSFVSFKFYQKISKNFPKVFRQRSIQRYYSRMICDYKRNEVCELVSDGGNVGLEEVDHEDSDDDDIEVDLKREMMEPNIIDEEYESVLVSSDLET